MKSRGWGEWQNIWNVCPHSLGCTMTQNLNEMYRFFWKIIKYASQNHHICFTVTSSVWNIWNLIFEKIINNWDWISVFEIFKVNFWKMTLSSYLS